MKVIEKVTFNVTISFKWRARVFVYSFEKILFALNNREILLEIMLLFAFDFVPTTI